MTGGSRNVGSTGATFDLLPGTNLSRTDLPDMVELNIRLDNLGRLLTPSVNNGTTDNALQSASLNTSNSVFTYKIPRSYVKAPGQTTVKVSVLALC